MEILSESIVYYGARNPDTGKYKAQRTYAYPTTDDMCHIKLYKRRKAAEYYGKPYDCTDIVKIKLVRIK